MSRRTMEVLLSAPLGDTCVAEVVYLRVETDDGARGIQAGHEPAVLTVRPGALLVRTRATDAESATRESFIGTEGGLVQVQRDRVTVVSTWFERAASLPALVQRLRGRIRQRLVLEHDLRAMLERHDAATRRALIRLQREVAR